MLNKTSRTLCSILGVLAMICILGVAGNFDRIEQVKYNIPNEVYHYIKSSLGKKCSDRQITEIYLSNKKYYDSLCLPCQNQ